jgi:hypothetical protein
MKTKIFIAVFILIICASNHLIAQNWLWAQSFAGTSGQAGQDIIAPNNGYIYSFGIYQLLDAVSPGTVVAGNVTISSQGSSNGFVAQYDQAGNFITITNVQSYPVGGFNTGGGGVGFFNYPTADDSNNLYIAVAIAANGLVDTIPVAYSSPPIALSKWNADSRCLWLHYFGGSSLMARFYGGYNYLLGNYQQPQIQIGTFQLSDPANKQQGYLAKSDAQGNCQWAKQATGGNIYFKYLDIVNDGICITASTDSCFIYDTLNVCPPAGKSLTVLMQLDTAGSIIWFKKVIASDQFSFIYKIAPIASGGFYVMGGLDTTLCIGNDTLHKLGNEIIDEFIAKFDTLGNILWVKQIPVSNGSLAIASIKVDTFGYFYLTGYFTGTQTFGNYSVTAQSARDLFVTRYSPAGECMGVVTVPNAQAYAVTEDSAGNAIVTGAIEATATFGNTTLTASSQTNFFIAKLSAINYPASETIVGPQDSLLQIYANPSKGIFTIVVPPSIVQASNGNLMIYDSQGSIVTNQTVDISSSNLQVNLGEIARGVYTVVLTANGRPFTGRVVIQ